MPGVELLFLAVTDTLGQRPMATPFDSRNSWQEPFLQQNVCQQVPNEHFKDSKGGMKERKKN